MKWTSIVASSLITLMAAFAQAQTQFQTPPAAFATPAPTPAPTPPIVGMNTDAPSAPPSSMPMQQPMPMPMPPGTGVSTYTGRPNGSVSVRVNPPPSTYNQQNNPQNNPPFNPNASGLQEKQPQSEIIKVLPPAQRPPEIRAVLRTSVGDITVRLDRVNAPITVDYFAGIAKGEMDFTDIKTSKPVKRPFYNGLIFHRVVKNTLIQTGDPFGNGRGNSGRTIPDEIKPSMKFDRPGLVAIAPMRESKGTDVAKGTNSSQFFITLREMPEWNGQYTIFGEVEDGLDVVQKIANSKVGPTERPIKRIYLVAVDILESAK